MNDILKLSVSRLSELLGKKEISSAEITAAYLERIKSTEDKVGAFLSINAENAAKAADLSDKRRAEGSPLSPIDGIPCAIKDNICTKGVTTTCASVMLKNFVPPYNATVVEKLEKAGVFSLGKLNLDEFAMGSTTENSAFKVTHNPRDLSRIPGGSSGGSAASVAALETPFALGSDTGGSIRQPAAFCGVVGMKPTYGTVSRYGLVAFASSLDQIGPLTSDVRDNAVILEAIAGHDIKDATSSKKTNTDFTSMLDKGAKGLKIGVPTEFFGDGISEEVKKGVLGAAEIYRKAGAELVEVSMPSLKYALPAYYVISSAEASSNLARFDGVRYGYRTSKPIEDIDSLYLNSRSEGFGKEVKRRIMLGTFALSSGYYDAYYKKALKVRTVILEEFRRIFEKCDVIIAPVAPTVAYKIGEKTENPLEMYMGDIYTVPVNIAGIPAISLPCGKTDSGLPIGMQLIGNHFTEALLYRAANAFENESGISGRSFATV